MGRKHVDARNKLWELQHDVKRMLAEGMNSEQIIEFIHNKLEKLKDSSYYKIDHR